MKPIARVRNCRVTDFIRLFVGANGIAEKNVSFLKDWEVIQQETTMLWILIGAFCCNGEPGPATLAIGVVFYDQGRFKVWRKHRAYWQGSLFGSCSAAFGLGAVLFANVWVIRKAYVCRRGLFVILAYKSLFVQHMANKTDEKQNIAYDEDQTQDVLRFLLFSWVWPFTYQFLKRFYSLGSLFRLGIAAFSFHTGVLSWLFLLTIQRACINFGYAMRFRIQEFARLF